MRALQPLLTFVAGLALASCATAPGAVDPTSDAPDPAPRQVAVAGWPATHADALVQWRSPSDVNGWIAARFEYDLNRALQLAENQRERGPRVQIHEPSAFYERPTGVCVDLARFAVETLRTTAPATRPAYLMIEFDPAVIAGHTLRRHWVAQYEIDGQWYFFADSKRPGHVAGPYGSVAAYVADYARYRQRPIVSYRTVDTYERQLRKPVPKTTAQVPG